MEPKRASTLSDTIPVDGLGYASIAAVAPPTSLAIASASSGELGDAGVESWQSGKLDLDLSAGSLHTAFVLSAEQGYASVSLWTVAQLMAAARLYRAVGFHLVEEVPGHHWGVDVIEQRYERSL